MRRAALAMPGLPRVFDKPFPYLVRTRTGDGRGVAERGAHAGFDRVGIEIHCWRSGGMGMRTL